MISNGSDLKQRIQQNLDWEEIQSCKNTAYDPTHLVRPGLCKIPPTHSVGFYVGFQPFGRIVCKTNNITGNTFSWDLYKILGIKLWTDSIM